MNTVEGLEKVKELLTPPGQWIQREYYRYGCYCLVGAMLKVEGLICASPSIFRDMSECLVLAVGNHSLVTWNDQPFRTQAEVLSALDLAIFLAKERKHVPAPESSRKTDEQS